MVDMPQGEAVLLRKSLNSAQGPWASPGDHHQPDVIAAGWNGQHPAQQGSFQQRVGSSTQKTNNFNIFLGCIQFSSVSLCGLNKLLPPCLEEELMIYGSTGTTLVSAEFKLVCMEPYLSV